MDGIIDLAKGNSTSVKHVHVSPSSPFFAWYIVIIVLLVLLGGLFSGLTLGLMGLDFINLQVLSLSGTPAERRQAPKVLDLIKKGRHTMLVVLLLGNTLVNTSLPIFLDSIVGGGYIAVLASTALEVIFSEIVPQSICSHYGLAIGASFAPAIRILVFLMYPIARPIGILLDYMLGSENEGVTYRKAELKTFVSLGVEDKLEEDELAILGSVLEFSSKVVRDVMTPSEDVYKLSAETIMDDQLIAEILRKGYSRIPVYEPSSPSAFIGFITIRALVEYDPTDLKPAAALTLQVLPQCPPDLSLLEAMAYFQTGRSHMLLITTSPGKNKGFLGVVTLEDVVEELIGKEIIDETDQYVDSHSRIPVVRPKTQSERPNALRRIFEGRLARHKVVLEAANGDEEGNMLIDHPINA